MSRVEARRWSDHVFGVYLLGPGRHRLGDFVGVAVGTREDALRLGHGHAMSPTVDIHVRTTGCCDGATDPHALNTPTDAGDPNSRWVENVDARAGASNTVARATASTFRRNRKGAVSP